MTEKGPIIITISRELGSGGAYVGQQLASDLKIAYIDRHILRQASQKLAVAEADVEFREETASSLVKSIFELYSQAYQNTYIPPAIRMPNEKELFKKESEVIQEIARKHSAVIIGRCGSNILRDHPRLLSVFLHADPEFRMRRLRELYLMDQNQALKEIRETDTARAKYYSRFTGRDWTDLREYHLAIDTSVVGLDRAEEIILDVYKDRFGEVIPRL